MRSFLLAASFLVVAAATTALPAAAEPAAGPRLETEGGSPDATWSLQPASEGAPDGRVSLRQVLDPGQVATDAVAITNFSAQPVSYDIYASDGTVTADGSFDLIPEDEEATDGGTWIAVGAVAGSTPRDGGGITLEVPAETVVSIPVEIAVPADASPGDHPAGIVAELAQAGDGVQLTSRVGVRVHLRVTGDIVAELSPEGVSVSYAPSWNPFAPGIATIDYTVANAGNVRLGADTTVSAAGPFGLAPVKTSAEQREVLPGDGAPGTVQLEVWPMFVAWGAVSAEPVVVGEDDVDAELRSGSVGFLLPAIPWPTLLYLALIVGAVLLLRAQRKRSAACIQARVDAAVAAATAKASVEADSPPVDQPRPEDAPHAAETEPQQSRS